MVSPQESLKQKKLLDSFSENIKYIPEEYAEFVTDTTLSNGFRVLIKLQTKMDSNIIVETKKDSITSKTHYRDFIGNISIFREDDTLLMSKEINKSFVFEQYESIDDYLIDYMKQLVLSNVWINYCNYNNENHACVNIAYCEPETSGNCLYFELSINKAGNYLLKRFAI